MNLIDRLQITKPKRIHVFENGRTDSYGYSVFVSSTKERTWNQILNHVTQVVQPSFGSVRHLKTINGRKSIHSFTDLVNGSRYVACGKEAFRIMPQGYRTESEHKSLKGKGCSQYYSKVDLRQEDNIIKHWALLQAQKNKRTVIHVFANGLKHRATKFVLMEHDLYNWQGFLSHTANMMDIPEGVCALYTLFGSRLCGPCEVQHGAYYVAVPCNERFQCMNYMAYHQKSKTSCCSSPEPYNFEAIGGPAHVEIRNDDCFFNKYLGPTKTHKEYLAEQLFERKIKSESLKLSKPQPCRRPKVANEKKVTRTKVSKPPELSHKKKKECIVRNTCCAQTCLCEVKVEEKGFKIVPNIIVATTSQLTQTDLIEPANESIFEEEQLVDDPYLTRNDTIDMALNEGNQLNNDRKSVNTDKLLKIDDHTEIIGPSSKYWNDDLPHLRQSILQRRSTGFNFQFIPVDSSGGYSADSTNTVKGESPDATEIEDEQTTESESEYLCSISEESKSVKEEEHVQPADVTECIACLDDTDTDNTRSKTTKSSSFKGSESSSLSSSPVKEEEQVQLADVTECVACLDNTDTEDKRSKTTKSLSHKGPESSSLSSYCKDVSSGSYSSAEKKSQSSKEGVRQFIQKEIEELVDRIDCVCECEQLIVHQLEDEKSCTCENSKKKIDVQACPHQDENISEEKNSHKASDFEETLSKQSNFDASTAESIHFCIDSRSTCGDEKTGSSIDYSTFVQHENSAEKTNTKVNTALFYGIFY